MKYNIDFFTQKFNELPEKIEIAVLGTTQGHFAFDFEGTNVYGANLCMTLNGLDFQKSFLMKYKERIEKGALILLTIQYPIFLCAGDDGKNDILNVQYAHCILGYHPYLSKEEELEYFRNPYRYIDTPVYMYLKNGMMRNSDRNHMRNYEIDLELQGLMRTGWEKEIYPIKVVDYDKNAFLVEKNERLSFNANCVLDVADYCSENGWNLVLVGLPYSKELNDKVPESFINDNYYEPIKQIVDQTKILFIDYSKDKEFLSIQNYFNTWFLNDLGRKKFTKRVLDDCERMM